MKNKPEWEETRAKCTCNHRPSISSLPSFDITGGRWGERNNGLELNKCWYVQISPFSPRLDVSVIDGGGTTEMSPAPRKMREVAAIATCASNHDNWVAAGQRMVSEKKI